MIFFSARASVPTDRRVGNLSAKGDDAGSTTRFVATAAHDSTGLLEAPFAMLEERLGNGRTHPRGRESIRYSASIIAAPIRACAAPVGWMSSQNTKRAKRGGPVASGAQSGSKTRSAFGECL